MTNFPEVLVDIMYADRFAVVANDGEGVDVHVYASRAEGGSGTVAMIVYTACGIEILAPTGEDGDFFSVQYGMGDVQRAMFLGLLKMLEHIIVHEKPGFVSHLKGRDDGGNTRHTATVFMNRATQDPFGLFWQSFLGKDRWSLARAEADRTEGVTIQPGS